MLAVERRNLIKDYIVENKSLIVSDMSEKFNVTEETIRRDLKVLEDEGVLVRTYGGAYLQNGLMNDINISIRETLFVENKKEIADLCKKEIHSGDTIFIDPSTTALFIAEAINNMNITVLSNSVKVIDALAPCSDVTLNGIGGSFSRKHMAFMGRGAVEDIKTYFVDKAFISCRSLSMQHGVSDSSERLSVIRREIIKRANKVYLVVDQSKFDKVSFLHICNFDKISHIVTDSTVSKEWKDFCSEHNIVLLTGKMPKV